MSESTKAHLFNDSKLLACLTQTALCECMKADSYKPTAANPKSYIPSTIKLGDKELFGHPKIVP